MEQASKEVSAEGDEKEDVDVVGEDGRSFPQKQGESLKTSTHHDGKT